MGPIWMLRASASARLALGVGLGLAACSNSSPLGTGGSGGSSTAGTTGSGGTNRGGNGGSTSAGGSAGSVGTAGSGGAGGFAGDGGRAGAAGGALGGAAGSGASGGSGRAGTAGTDGSGGTSGAKDAGNGTAGTAGSAPEAGGGGSGGNGGTGGSGGTVGRDVATDVPATADVHREPAVCHAAATFMVMNQSASAYLFDGTMSNPTLTLCRGTTYTFAVNASGHPFYIKTAQVTGTANTWDAGVTNNGAAVGNVVFVVPPNAPDTLFYQCSIHSVMTGTLHIVN